MEKQDRQTTVFFDGSCPLCRAEIDVYRSHDTAGILCFVDVSKHDVALPAPLDPKIAMARFHVMSQSGDLFSGASAFVELWKQLPRWRWVARLAALPGVTPTLELIYHFFLKIRPVCVRAFLVAQRSKSGV